MNVRTQYLLTVVATTAAILTVAAFTIRAMRWAKKGKPGRAALFWPLLFLSSGRMPPPPPQTQIEQETGEKKHREIDRIDPDAT